jgi:plastocyanin
MLSIITAGNLPQVAQVITSTETTSTAPDTSKLNCITKPSACGYPDETNTGVPATKVAGLKTLSSSNVPAGSTFNGETLTIIQDGAVIDGYIINAGINVKAANVTIRNSKVVYGGYYPIENFSTGLVVEDTEIMGTSKSVTAGISFSNYKAVRVKVTGTADGLKADDNVTIEDSYITELCQTAGTATSDPSHNDGVQMYGSGNVTLRHNTIKGSFMKISGCDAPADVTSIQVNSPANNTLIENNLIDGSGYWGVNGGGSATFRIINNRFTSNYLKYPVNPISATSQNSGNFFDVSGKSADGTPTPPIPNTTTSAPTLDFAVTPTTITTGNTVTLTWSSINATNCSASGNWIGTKGTSGSEATAAITTAGTYTYTLTCTGASGSVTKSATVTASAPVTTTPTLKIGDRIVTLNNVNVRTAGLISATTLIGVNPVGSQGVIVSGPTVSVDTYGTVTWFNINFDTGFDGWVGADNYVLATSTPVFTIIDTDKDTVADSVDNCPAIANTDQSDRDKDGIGDVCDSTPDGVVVTTTWPSIYKAGTSIQTTARINVRSVAGGQVIGKQSLGATGVVQSQKPVVVKGYTWIYVDFVNAPDGWVADSFLKQI